MSRSLKVVHFYTEFVWSIEVTVAVIQGFSIFAKVAGIIVRILNSKIVNKMTKITKLKKVL